MQQTIPNHKISTFKSNLVQTSKELKSRQPFQPIVVFRVQSIQCSFSYRNFYAILSRLFRILYYSCKFIKTCLVNEVASFFLAKTIRRISKCNLFAFFMWDARNRQTVDQESQIPSKDYGEELDRRLPKRKAYRERTL